jgi:hypothetical protein
MRQAEQRACCSIPREGIGREAAIGARSRSVRRGVAGGAGRPGLGQLQQPGTHQRFNGKINGLGVSTELRSQGLAAVHAVPFDERNDTACHIRHSTA